MMELTVEAKLDNLEKVLQFVDSRLEEADCPMGMQMKVDVAVEAEGQMRSTIGCLTTIRQRNWKSGNVSNT